MEVQWYRLRMLDKVVVRLRRKPGESAHTIRANCRNTVSLQATGLGFQIP